ncbi:MAG: phosphoribosylanthranilate isomerase [Betaproteobacteria bacterium]|nr:phosphoribosylanthranilate isomerase [Betaproteobacteria bacterium]
MRTRIKICGIRHPDDALCAAEAGADAIGLVFYPASPRAVSIEVAVEIQNCLPPFVDTVALFVNPTPGLVHDVITQVKPTLLQFHGDESPDFCASFAHPYLKAVRVKATMRGEDLLQSKAAFGRARALLLDTFNDQLYGGSGERFNWEMIPGTLRQSIVLSGGLTPDNVASAVKAIRPWAVDVSSGVEQQKGIKDPAKITAFIEAVQLADQGI